MQVENIVAYESVNLVVSLAGADQFATRGAPEGFIGRGAGYGYIAMVRLMVPLTAQVSRL